MLDVIAFAAHPDDAEACCGGLLLKLARRGYRTAICDLTRGERGSNGTPVERAREAAAAAAQLGLASRLQLGLADGGLERRAPAQVACVVDLLRAHGPRLIVAPHPRGRHPDHAETSALVRRAHFFCAVHGYGTAHAPVERPVLLFGLDYYPLRPSFVVDVSAELAGKLAALRCYRSQFERAPGSVATLLNDPAYLQRVETAARHYGGQIGRAAGEPFVVEGGVPVDDPVRLFGPPCEVHP
jgi:bacillithiol biosynthesis deacetylase BshB1